MHYSHINLLEQLSHSLTSNSLAKLIYKVYASNPQAKFDREVKSVIENYNDAQARTEEEVSDAPELNHEAVSDSGLQSKEKLYAASEYWFIRNLYIRDFRKYPLLKQDKFFRLNLEGENPDVPQSLILLGNNGVGKSSLYSAIEYITGNPISEAVIRKLDQGIYTKHNVNCADDAVRVILHTNNRCIYHPAAFVRHFDKRELNILLCSENDILELGQSHGDEILLWASVCGYAEICELINNLNDYAKQLRNDVSQHADFIDEMQSSEEKAKALENELKFLLSCNEGLILFVLDWANQLDDFLITENDTKERKQELKVLAENCRKAIMNLFSTGLLKELFTEYEGLFQELSDSLDASSATTFKTSSLVSIESNKTKLVSWMRDIKNKYINALLNTYHQSLQPESVATKPSKADLEYNIKLSDSIENYSDELRNALVDRVLDVFGECKCTIEQVMAYFGRSFPDYEFRCEQRDRKIILKVCKKGCENDNYLPDYFFNNFRFKLLYMTLKVAMGIAFMKKHGPFPIVLDDIFYASDFYSRKNIQWFWKALLDLMGPELKDKVQIICFTHDEVVFSAIRETILSKYEPERFTFGRLLELDWKALEQRDDPDNENLNLYVDLFH